jgi:hypothetical protein
MDFFNFSQEGEAHYSERVTPSTQEDWISVWEIKYFIVIIIHNNNSRPHDLIQELWI